MKHNKTFVLMLLAFLVLGFSNIGKIQAAPESKAEASALPATIKIGLLAPISGDLEAVGAGIVDGAKAAALEINNSAAFSFSVELLVEDSKVNAIDAVAGYELLKGQGVELIIGAAASAASKPVAEKASVDEIVQISYASTAAVLSNASLDYFWRVVPGDLLQSEALVDLLDHENITKIVVVNRGDDWGKGIGAGVAAAFSGTVVDQVEYPDATKDFASVVTAVKAATGAEAIALGAFTEDGRALVTELRSGGVDLPIFGADGTGDAGLINETFSATIKEDLEGFIGTRPDLSGGGSGYAAYEAALTACKTAGSCTDDAPGRIYGVTAYDAMWVGALAVNMSTAYEGSLINANMPAAGASYIGGTGNRSFDALGDPTSGLYEVYQFISGDLEVVGTWNAEDLLVLGSSKVDVAWPGRTGGVPGFEGLTLIFGILGLGTLVVLNRKRK
ncbi:MAG: ABC transporter substrate-binding protein [Candidatus Hodarchaeales archaeon]|jgi:branched-chain amino acid transport system substrate-binding protein